MRIKVEGHVFEGCLAFSAAYLFVDKPSCQLSEMLGTLHAGIETMRSSCLNHSALGQMQGASHHTPFAALDDRSHRAMAQSQVDGSDVQPSATYGNLNGPVCLRIATGGAGQSGILRALAEGFLKR